jgi:hypothetical protein
VFKQCALAMLVPFLAMIALGLLMGVFGPYLIRRVETSKPPAAAGTRHTSSIADEH